jgi:cobalamin biosynthesis Mg chelatase CobN
MHVLVGPSTIHAVGLPAGAPDLVGATHWATVTDAHLHVALSSTNATSDTYTYNWTQGPNPVNVTYVNAPQNGTVKFTIKDGAGTVLQVKTLTAGERGSRNFDAAHPGTYNVTVEFTSYKGAFTLDLVAHASDSGTTTSSTSTHTGSSTTSAGTTSGSSSSASTTAKGSSSSTAKGTPGLGLVLVLAAVGAVVAVRRRL